MRSWISLYTHPEWWYVTSLVCESSNKNAMWCDWPKVAGKGHYRIIWFKRIYFFGGKFPICPRQWLMVFRLTFSLCFSFVFAFLVNTVACLGLVFCCHRVYQEPDQVSWPVYLQAVWWPEWNAPGVCDVLSGTWRRLYRALWASCHCRRPRLSPRYTLQLSWIPKPPGSSNGWCVLVKDILLIFYDLM